MHPNTKWVSELESTCHIENSLTFLYYVPLTPPVFEAHFLGPEHLSAHSSLSALLACVWSKISSSETIGSLTRSKVTAACFQRWHTES